MDEISLGRMDWPDGTGTPLPCSYYNKKRNVQPSKELTFLLGTLQFCKVSAFSSLLFAF